MKQSEIAGGKGVRLSERAHGHVLRCPFADAGQFAELLEKAGHIYDPEKIDLSVADSLSQGADTARTRTWKSDATEVSAGQAFGRGKRVREDACIFKGDTEGAHQAAGQGGGSTNRDLLAQDGAN